MKKYLLPVCIICMLIPPILAQKRGQTRIDSLLQDLEITRTDTHQANGESQARGTFVNFTYPVARFILQLMLKR